MDNTEVKQLIDSFKAYRDLLIPIQKNLNDFIGTYDAMRASVDILNASFGGDLKGKLDGLFKEMSTQSTKAADLSGQIDRLASSAGKYAQEVNQLMSHFSKIEERLKAVNAIEEKATVQIARLDAILEEKTKSYNLKDLQIALDGYNRDVKKVGEFINREVADSLMDSRAKLDTLRGGLDGVVKAQSENTLTLNKLLESYSASGEFLKKIAQSQDVNEAYLFEVLDRWAESRRVKTK